MKFRFKLRCGHWTPVLDAVVASAIRDVQTYPCAKCDEFTTPLVPVQSERQLKDTEHPTGLR